jgi:NAD-dependent DNA ligase
VLYVQDCAARLQGINGVGPRAVQALLAFASEARSVGLVDGLLGHIQFTSQSQPTKATKITAAAPVDAASRAVADVPNKAQSRQLTTPLGPTGMHDQLVANSTPLAGKVVVFTGKLESGMSRGEAEKQCRALGEFWQYAMCRSAMDLTYVAICRRINAVCDQQVSDLSGSRRGSSQQQAGEGDRVRDRGVD